MKLFLIKGNVEFLNNTRIETRIETIPEVELKRFNSNSNSSCHSLVEQNIKQILDTSFEFKIKFLFKELKDKNLIYKLQQ